MVLHLKNSQTTLHELAKAKKVNEALREIQHKYQTLVEALEDCVWEADSEGKVVFCSPQAERFSGYRLNEIIGKTPFDFLPEKERESALKTLRAHTKSKQPLKGYESPAVNAQGKLICMETSVYPFFDVHGRLIGYRGVTRDVTERKQAEETLKQRTEELERIKEKLEAKGAEVEKYAANMELLAEERANQLRDAERLATIGATAGMVGHDIRNPLQAIVNELYYAKLMMTESADGAVKKQALESIFFIEEQVDYISKIVADLQDYARPLKPQIVELNLKDLAKMAINTLIIPKQIETELNIADSLTIYADSSHLRRALSNLITNAIQAMPAEGKLTINGMQQNAKAIITVEDTGVGILEETKQKLFTPFYTTKARGQGLGLVVVKRLVEAMDGSVACESQVGVGTKFIIELPLKK
jgi:PAS domain S-box-containing protein